MQIALAAIAGAAAIALFAAAAVGAFRAVDVTGFYPSTTHRYAWSWQGDAFVSPGRGLRVEADGSPVRVGTPAEPLPLAKIPPAGRAAASLATAFAGVALPMLMAQWLLARHASPSAQQRLGAGGGRGSGRWPALASAAAVVGSLMLFQAAAARLVPALLAALPPAGLLAFAVGRYRREAT
jgi:hypothetical protein